MHGSREGWMETPSAHVATESPTSRLRRAWLKIAEARRRSGIRNAALTMVGVVRAGLPVVRREIDEVLLDVRLRSRTRGIVHNEATLRRVSSVGDSQPYEAVHLDWWRQLMSVVPLTPARTTFLDLGAGRGRAVILAARAGFGRVIGLEIDPYLAALAERNLHRSMRHRRQARWKVTDYSIVLGDAAIYPLPSGNLLICLYNPFGPETLRRVLGRLTTRTSDRNTKAMVAYFNPAHADVFEQFPSLRTHAQGDNWMLYELSAPSAQ
jgi:SAM-dependent methyltransferase